MVYTTENLQDDDRQSERSGVLLSSARGAARISKTPRGGTAGLFSVGHLSLLRAHRQGASVRIVVWRWLLCVCLSARPVCWPALPQHLGSK